MSSEFPKTIFILGAGASHPYGFPLGSKLVDDIINLTDSRNSSSGHFFSLLLRKFNAKDIVQFNRHLSLSNTNSIDSFLYRNSQFLELGKSCIAYSILSYENESITKNVKDDHWYKYFWNEINGKSPDDFDFKIYTFNYDRSFENNFKEFSTNLFPIPEDVKKFNEKISVTHLHGSLGNHLYGDIKNILSFTELELLAKEIKIIFEVEEDDNFRQLHEDLKHAHHIVFLGFGFHEDNMSRMKILDIRYVITPHFYTSTFGLGKAQIKSKIERYVNYVLSDIPKERYREFFIEYSTNNLKFLQEGFPMHHLFKKVN